MTISCSAAPPSGASPVMDTTVKLTRVAVHTLVAVVAQSLERGGERDFPGLRDTYHTLLPIAYPGLDQLDVPVALTWDPDARVADERIKRALRNLGNDTWPDPNWQARVWENVHSPAERRARRWYARLWRKITRWF